MLKLVLITRAIFFAQTFRLTVFGRVLDKCEQTLKRTRIMCQAISKDLSQIAIKTYVHLYGKVGNMSKDMLAVSAAKHYRHCKRRSGSSSFPLRHFAEQINISFWPNEDKVSFYFGVHVFHGDYWPGNACSVSNI